MTEFAIGIDGGGSSCRAAIADRMGKIIGRGKAGAANILSDQETSLVNIIQSAREACRDAGLDPQVVASVSAVVGVAGANVGDYGKRVQAALPFARAQVVTDALIALQGALGDGDGVVGAFGTGSVYGVRRDGKTREIGGWGLIVGDQASGARLGRDLLEAALLSHDGVRPASVLTKKIMAEFGNDPEQVVEFAHVSKPKDFARYAPVIFEHAEQGDTVAVAIVRTAALSIGESLDALLWPECRTICLLGGLAPAYRNWLDPKYAGMLSEPKGDNLQGAVSFAVQLAQGKGAAA
ncbi:N-acetylglucosamine kinase [Rhizobium sp. BK251]|uniref:N-acetylglucosamine kinase n=1 Tax=Rhizobium sp. BK251 TaxID=2512125 RepID=UPI001053C9CD|nr:N-acetylglucosamine kinase [Rhizobium sp. BK251]TCL74934.1 glucosamine kinase [Rhizobium sp. BK251]